MLLSIRSRQQSHRGTEEKASEQHHNHSKGKAPSQQVDCFPLSQNEEGTSWNEQGRLTDKEEAKIHHSCGQKKLLWAAYLKRGIAFSLGHGLTRWDFVSTQIVHHPPQIRRWIVGKHVETSLLHEMGGGNSAPGWCGIVDEG
jgi:hypothetical protein